MEREEIAERMRESIINKNKELIIQANQKVTQSIHQFVTNQIGLLGDYPEMSIKVFPVNEKHTIHNIDFNFKGNVLSTRLDSDRYKIIIIKINESNQEEILDVIVASNEKLTCYDGDFKIEEVDDYLSKSIAKLLG